MLLIAGQAVDHTSWRLAAVRLGQGRRLVMFDHRSVGVNGSVAADRFSTKRFADDVVHVLDAAGMERAGQVGHSMAGPVAQQLASITPSALGGWCSPSTRRATCTARSATRRPPMPRFVQAT